MRKINYFLITGNFILNQQLGRDELTIADLILYPLIERYFIMGEGCMSDIF